jgi:hypothetical protein
MQIWMCEKAAAFLCDLDYHESDAVLGVAHSHGTSMYNTEEVDGVLDVLKDWFEERSRRPGGILVDPEASSVIVVCPYIEQLKRLRQRIIDIANDEYAVHALHGRVATEASLHSLMHMRVRGLEVRWLKTGFSVQGEEAALVILSLVRADTLTETNMSSLRAFIALIKDNVPDKFGQFLPVRPMLWDKWSFPRK